MMNGKAPYAIQQNILSHTLSLYISGLDDGTPGISLLVFL